MKLVVTSAGQAVMIHEDRRQNLYRRLGGPVQIVRAAQVEWEEDRWVARSARTGEIWADGPLREDVLRKERETVEAQLADLP